VGRLLFELGSTTLFDEINSRDFKEAEILEILRDICQGLAEIHQMEMCHLDLKPENVILVGETYKLCDFGSVLTEPVDYDGLSEGDKESFEDYIQNNSTVLYRAPEMINPSGKTVGSSADMWMLGCIAYIMTFGRHPFQGKDLSSVT
jgi:serine/threonine protein kinase